MIQPAGYIRGLTRGLRRDGVRIFVTHTIRSFNLEPWVQRVAALSGQPVDWHYVGGRAVVLALAVSACSGNANVAPQMSALTVTPTRGPVGRVSLEGSARIVDADVNWNR